MATLEPLTITHLNISYQLFFDQNSQYYLDNSLHETIDDNTAGFTYHKIYSKEYNNVRILFPPVATQNIMHPTAKSLEWALKYLTDNLLFKINHPIKKIVIPVGEVSNFLGIMDTNHMLTLIIEYQDNGKKNICLIDSKSFSLPGSAKTQLILDTLNKYLNNFDFKRYYVQHQNIIDRVSCCYFSFKFLHLALQSKDMEDFLQRIPKPNTLVHTSKNLLTNKDEDSILQKIKTYYQSLENLAEEFIIETF